MYIESEVALQYANDIFTEMLKTVNYVSNRDWGAVNENIECKMRG